MAERKSMIHVRGGFSEAHGMGSCNTQMQINELDKRTRNILCNCISMSLDGEYSKTDSFGYLTKYKEEDFLCRMVFSYALGLKIDVTKHYSINELISIIDEVFSKAPYNEIFDLIEQICRFRYKQKERLDEFCKLLNIILENEYVGYRMIEGRFVPITDENEITSIEDACNNKFEGVRAHISKAVGFIADRERKDCKNCIKESISAVESSCSIIVEDESATLGKAIKQLKDKGMEIHPALERAFLSFYGYTSDEGGIRHSEGMFESDVTFEEAKFMLVSCSAFVNYLTANYGKVGGEHA